MKTARRNHAVSLVDLRDYFGICIDLEALKNSLDSFKKLNSHKTIG